MPDDIFEAWCEGNGYGDGIAFNDSVSSVSISVPNQIDIGGKNIMDLTGIEGFTNLQYFYADHNLFQVADLRHNHSLSQIDIGNNDSLRQVYFPDTVTYVQGFVNYTIYEPGIGYVYIDDCPNLDTLILPSYSIYYLRLNDNHNLSFLDLSGQEYMDYLSVTNCDSLQSLDVRNLGYLRTLYIETYIIYYI